MPDISLIFKCPQCKKILTIVFDEKFQKKFKAAADKWPYPLMYPHNKHWAMIYLDQDFRERGVTATDIAYP